MMIQGKVAYKKNVKKLSDYKARLKVCDLYKRLRIKSHLIV